MTLASPFMARAPVQAAGSAAESSFEVILIWWPARFKRRRDASAMREQERLRLRVGFGVHVGARDRATLRARRSRRAERLVHAAADGARPPPALRAAAETTIDLVGGRRAGRGAVEGGPHVTVAEHVAGTNDHCGTYSRPGWTTF